VTLYCKAYRLADLRQFPDWEKLANEREQELDEDTIVYITDSYQVSEDCLATQDETSQLLARISDEWKVYCKEKLQFATPDWDLDSQK
jgi:hypothetical protein